LRGVDQKFDIRWFRKIQDKTRIAEHGVINAWMKRKTVNPRPPKRRRALAFATLCPPEVFASSAPNPTLDNMLIGVLGRVVLNASFEDPVDGLPAPPLQPKPGLWESHWKWIKGPLDKALQEEKPKEVIPLDKYWTTFASNPQKVRYREVAETFRFRDLTKADLSADAAAISGLMKNEFTGRTKPPRSIGVRCGDLQPERKVKVLVSKGKKVTTTTLTSSWIYAAVTGCHIKGYESITRNALNRVYQNSVCHPDFTCFAKGLCPDAIAKLIGEIMDKTGLVAVCTDAHKWDGSVSEAALKYEHKVWLARSQSSILPRLLSQQLINKCVWRMNDGSFGITFRGRRNSGDPNTGTGNDIINSQILVAFLRKLRVRGHVLVQGDDSILFVPPSVVGRAVEEIVEHYADHGFRSEIEGVGFLPEEVCFCHVRPCRTVTGGWRAVKHVKDAVKELRTVKQFGNNPNKQALLNYFATRAQAAAMIYGSCQPGGTEPWLQGIPIFSAIAEGMGKAAKAQGGRFNPRLLDRYSVKMALKWATPQDPVDPVSFALTQSLLPSSVQQIHSFYQSAAYVFDPGGEATFSRGFW